MLEFCWFQIWSQPEVRFLVFAHHLAMLDHLESDLADGTGPVDSAFPPGSLQQSSVRYIRIDGSTPMANRNQILSKELG